MRWKLFWLVLLALVIAVPAQARPRDLFSDLVRAVSKMTAPKATRKQVRHTRKTSLRATVVARAPRLKPAVEVAAVTVAEPRGRVQELVVQYAKSEGIPTALAYAVARHESGFNPSARGRAGEWGVMQIKCSTAKGIGYRGSCNGLANAETNVKWGMRYLSGAHKLAGGSKCGTLSRYNGGLGTRRLIPGYCARVLR